MPDSRPRPISFETVVHATVRGRVELDLLGRPVRVVVDAVEMPRGLTAELEDEGLEEVRRHGLPRVRA